MQAFFLRIRFDQKQFREANIIILESGGRNNTPLFRARCGPRRCGKHCPEEDEVMQHLSIPKVPLRYSLDMKTGKVRNSPDIISRGFIYLRESQELLKQSRYVIRKSIEEMTSKMNPINMVYVRESLREKVAKFLFQKTKRKPMVLPVIIEV